MVLAANASKTNGSDTQKMGSLMSAYRRVNRFPLKSLKHNVGIDNTKA
jgi:hypothetical protein